MSEHGRTDGEQVGYGRVERRAFRRQAEMFLQASPAVRARWVACTPRDAAGTLAVAAAARRCLRVAGWDLSQEAELGEKFWISAGEPFVGK